MKYKHTHKSNLTRAKLYTAIVIFVFIFIVLIPQATGIQIHEWGSFIIIIPLIVHILLDWKWLVTVSKRIFMRQPIQTRFNYYLDWLLFILMIIALASGVVISESVLPLFGIMPDSDLFWSVLHSLSATLLMIVFGIHIGMHWKWIIKVFKRFSFRKPTQFKLKNLFALSTLILTIRNFFLQVFIIVLLGLLISNVVLLLEDTEWANTLRSTYNVEGGIGATVATIRVLVMIGVPVLIIQSFLWIVKK